VSLLSYNLNIGNKMFLTGALSMQNQTSFVRARIEPVLKIEAESVLSELGITPTQAIKMLYKRIARDQEWPLELKIPNQETLEVFEETDQGVGLIQCKDIDDLFHRLDI
jgi:DNA-damage-inducible protein J